MRSAVCIGVLVAACAAPRFAPLATIAPPRIDVARITGRWSNVYLIREGDATVLVDSGSPVDCARLDAALAGEPRVRAVIVTHAHADHAGCARELQRRGAAIVLGAGDVATAARGTNARLQPTGLLAALLAPLFMFPFEPFTPDLAVDREVDLGAYGFPEVRVAPAPGHTPGELAVFAGDTVFVGDMIKGGEVLAHSPTEHLYQSDRAGDHAALGAVVGRPGVAALYPGHGGRLDAHDVRAWLARAPTRGRAGALEIELDARAELPDGGTGGLRVRHAFGGRVAYVLGGDVRAGYLGHAELDADEYPVGIAVRGQGGGLAMLTAGAGFGGVRGIASSRAIGELDVELPVSGARVLARASLGWRISGPKYAGDVGGVADELNALLGVRLGGDEPWGAYIAGHGPFVAATFSDLGGERRYGVALGVELFSAR